MRPSMYSKTNSDCDCDYDSDCRPSSGSGSMNIDDHPRAQTNPRCGSD
jgi:hypothetical protein